MPALVAVLLAALAGMTATPERAAAQSLADTLVAAYNTSNLLEQNRALLRAADEDVAIAVSRLRPVVDFVAAATARSARIQTPAGITVRDNDLTGTLSLRAQLTLFDFGRSRLGVQAATATVLATRAALVGLEQRVLLSGVQAFMQVRAALSAVALREANVRVITQELRAAQDRFEVGEITRTDVAIAEARLAGARALLAAAQGELAVARETFRAVTGAYPGNLRPLPALPALPPSLQAAQQIARERHPSIREAQQQVLATDLILQAIQAGRQGAVTGSAQLSVDDDGRDASSLSLSFARPLYTGGRQSAEERQARARRDAARANLAQSAVVVVEDVGRAWAQLAVAVAQLQASDRQIAAAQTAFEGVQQEAALGARTTLDVLNAEQELLDARAARIDAETSRTIAVYALLSSMGLLTVDHLGLGIPTYDPEAYFNAVRRAPATRSVQGDRLDRVLRRMQP